MVNETYRAYINSPKWKAKTALYVSRYGRKCQACGSLKKGLHIHHMSYDNFGNEPLSDLIGLCYPCHREVHRLHRKNGRKHLRMITLRYVQRVKIKG
jgi:5-methylcytosine-specific restriction endonuclease McrA